ncbi:macrolide ABC transporter ATP-binding protein [Candidatus Shapirobacteria bacterium RIFOXYD1_FULL_38_32]|uniref:ABC transporter ATP-binding protein n=2 Tax=Candidatus Shapironibacteriota TaxID=1752721 RepID=A0A0G0JRZ5_9BACT|nr:MAG: ABC transporter ATP-binding protein [Candidatus Shapirobacteria bacterium GW2011_GWE2_38_30]OGL55072.1 MAG: macrolide ABC transporter ATP-binding protein [Candidatus Shapirobacteria bacterium RIFOXYA1_FULL_39_17]OGL57557.1 MAG: macrolide ABC transporter ATP-binding protein [Candidatus Shapirobacteria bacterium RIFOXYC1_FULL_38_24]OGL57610.1 MAG: macrolide ABC transporter ATP-binding protein [Candidatus Shapirobacteria bacterium RIFOXYB1_FULL_38_38]OGL57854.1 MAG: macrolide ABC transport
MTRLLSKKSKSTQPVLELKNIVKTYTSGNTTFNALDGVSVCINRGEFVSITGPSGSGKSTLMHIVGLLDNPTSGQVLLEGQDISHFNEEELAKTRNITLGFVFQQFNLLAKTSAIENVSLPLLYSNVPKSERLPKSIEMLKKVGLGDKLKNTPAQLSGGQQQRVAIARALINDPKIIMADEPTGNLDSKSGKEIMNIFHQLHRENRTIILVTHDMELAKQAQRIIIIKDGKVTSNPC